MNVKATGKKFTYMRAIYLQFFAVLMAAAACINLTLFGYYMWREQRIVREEKERQLDQSLFYIERILAEADTVSASIWGSAKVQDILKSSRQKPDYLMYRDCMDYLAQTISNVNAVAWADLYLSDSGYLVTSNDGVFYHLDENEKSYYEQMKGELNEPIWAMDYQEHYLSYFHRSHQVITLMRPIFSTLNGRKAGVLCVGVPVNELHNYLTDETDEEGMVLFEPPGKDTSYEILQGTDETSGFSVYLYYKKHPAFPALGPAAVCMAGIILLFGAACAMIIRIAEKRMMRPVTMLMEAMKEMESGTFGVQIKEERRDVFGDIFQGFNHMAANLQRLVYEVLEERVRKEEFRYRLLQSQINPHFLYNIFNNMIWMSEQKDYTGLEQMISATAGYYKTALNHGNQDICLADNLKQLKCYVQIQKVRFAGQFECELAFEEEILSMSIPNFFLQPLLENAITHGARDKKGVTQILVTGWLEDGFLNFEVWDDGCGIGKERLREIQEAIREGKPGTDGNYFALANIAGRMALRWKKKAEMEIDSVCGQWTKITLRIPEDEHV